MKLTILGCNSAIPTKNSAPTAQLLNISERNFLIDCGEGTQSQLRKAKISFSKINHIFISHLHGDHVFGLIGLLNTYQLLGREKPLHIFGPKNIKQFIHQQLALTNVVDAYPIVFHELESKQSELIFEDDKLTVHTIPLDHRIYTNGFLFKEKQKPRHLNISAILRQPEIETCDYQNIKSGKDFVKQDGTTIPNHLLTSEPDTSYSYAFCSDTRFKPDIVPIIQHVDLLYHEATFLDELKDLATKTGHSTAKQAATIAKLAGVNQLIIGHFSNRYKDNSTLLTEAKLYFNNTFLAEQLKTFSVNLQAIDAN